MNYNSATLVIAVASLVVAAFSVWFAVSSLRLAKMDWRQRKWFELYFKASEVHTSLDHFQGKYGTLSPALWGMPEVRKDWNDLMSLIRDVHSMAAVFPKNPAVLGFIESTAVFKDRDEALSKERLMKIFDAVEGLRRKALVDTSVLEE